MQVLVYRRNCMKIISSTQVFTPGKTPDLTYNDRHKLGERLNFRLDRGGQIIVVSGPSKVGKTVLIKKSLENEKLVSVQGGDIVTIDGFINEIFKKLKDLPKEKKIYEKEEKLNKTEAELTAELGAKVKFWGVFKSGTVIEGRFKKTGAVQEEVNNNYLDDPFSRVVEYMISNQYILVIDDFHYVPKELQKALIQKLKSPLNDGLKIVFALIPNRTSIVVEHEPDMSGRVHVLEIPTWEKEDLGYIPDQGFKKLNVTLDEELRDELIQNSFSSPYLMQDICSFLAYYSNINETEKGTTKHLKLEEETLKEVYKEIATNDTVIEYLELGRTQRGTQRIPFSIKNPPADNVNNILDIYELVMLGLEVHAISNVIELDDLFTTIQGFNPERVKSKTKVKLNDVTKTLSSFTQMAIEKNPNDPAIEFKNDVNKIYMYDANFSFNLKFRRIS